MKLWYDICNESLIIENDKGTMWFFWEDSVAIKNKLPEYKCYGWQRLSKVYHNNPYTDPNRYEFLGEWK